MHVVDDIKWDEFLMGTIDTQSQAYINLHLLSCPTCWSTYCEQSPALKKLMDACSEAKQQLTVSDEYIQQRFAKFTASTKISHHEYLPATLQIKNKIKSLKALLTPNFGAYASERAILLAADTTRGAMPQDITHEQWHTFLKRLEEIVALVCGDAFALAITEHGKLERS